jgi:Flp pilus assembly protein TadG
MRMKRGRDTERGSMVVEFAIAAPILIGLMLFMVGAGRVVTGFGQVDGAARDGARAASIARTPGEAQQAAASAVQSDLNGVCTGGLTIFPVTGFDQGSASVTLRITCRMNLGYLLFPTVTVNGTGVAPLDQFVSRTY